MKMYLKLSISLLVFLMFRASAQSKSSSIQSMQELSKDLTSGKVLQLDALEIRAQIHEPTLIYILDKPNFHVNFNDENIKLSPNIPSPIIRNQLK